MRDEEKENELFAGGLAALNEGSELSERQARALAGRALSEDDAPMIKRLLEAGLDPNGGASPGLRWICEAARRSSAPILEAFLAAGASASKADIHRDDPLAACCAMNFRKEGALADFKAKVEALGRAGAEMKGAGGDRARVFLSFVGGSRLDMPEEAFRILWDRGFDFDAPIATEQGGSLLHSAARFNAPEKWALLLELGADPLRRDEMGRRPVDMAREAGLRSQAEALRAPTERAELERGVSPARRAGPRAL